MFNSEYFQTLFKEFRSFFSCSGNLSYVGAAEFDSDAAKSLFDFIFGVCRPAVKTSRSTEFNEVRVEYRMLLP